MLHSEFMQKRIKGFIFISNVTKAMEHEWFADFTDQERLHLRFILFNSENSDLDRYLRGKGFACNNYQLKSKALFPFYVFYFWTLLLMKRPNFVHCHLFEASLIGLLAAKWAGVKKRFSTRHHSDFHHLYHPHAVKYDLWVNAWSTQIIAVSNNVAQILKEKEGVAENKIVVIPHGVPKKLMHEVVPATSVLQLQEKYALNEGNPVIGVVSRFVEWKGIQFIIPAFAELLKEYPKALLVLANAGGNYEKEIETSLKKHLAESCYRKIPFENDGRALFKCFDVFVHVPIDATCEAFGQVYMEAMFLEVPMVCTLSGMATEIIKDKRNALVCAYRDSTAILDNLRKVLADEQLRKNLIQQAAIDIESLSFEKKFDKIMSLYFS